MGKWSDLLLKPQPVADDVKVEPGKYSRALLGGGQAEVPQADTPAAPDAMAEPDADTWMGRRAQDVRGKQDPRFKDLPDLRDALVEEGSTDVTRPMALSSLLNSSDAQMGDIAKNALGERYIGTDKDANGYDIVRYRAKDGAEKAAYLNRPGLDINDAGRALTGALPYMAVGGGVGALARGAGTAVQAIGQGLGAAATSIGGDVAQMPMGSEQGIELPKAAFAAGGGLIAPPIAAGVSAIARRIVTLPSLFKNGQLTPKGEAVAKSAKIDPAELSAEAQRVFAKTYAMDPDAAQAATRASVEPFGIPATKGQVSKDPFLLTQEEGMRRRLYGQNAQDIMRTFDVEQSQAVRDAALGAKPQSVTSAIAPGRNPVSAPQDANPMVLGQSVREGINTARSAARTAENEVWDKVGPLTATEDALKMLPDSLDARLGTEVVIDAETTPAAAKMAKDLDAFSAGESPQQVAKILKTNPVRMVDQQRRRLLSMSRGAATPEDKRAATAIYDGYNDWIDAAAEANLLAGDPGAAAQLKIARGFTKEVREIFQPSVGGKSTAAAKRLAGVMEKADSPEGVINQLLGSSGSRGVDSGTVGALASYKTAVDRFAPKDIAKAAWDDVRLAYWVRLVNGRNGELLGPTAIMNNIKGALSGQQSVVRTLYTPAEEKTIRQFAQALETISYKPPNASGSGYTAASFIKEGVAKLFEAFGLKSKIGQAALEFSGLGNAYGTAQARAAVGQSIKPRSTNLAPAFSSGGANVGRATDR
jgi:hypothetical protein